MNPKDSKPAEKPAEKIDPKLIEKVRADKQQQIAGNQIITKDGKRSNP